MAARLGADGENKDRQKEGDTVIDVLQKDISQFHAYLLSSAIPFLAK